MLKNGRSLFLAGGIMAALMLAFSFGGSIKQPAQAQPPGAPLPAVGRYQISSFTIQKGETPGAYVLDTQSGEVFQVIGKSLPERIGSVAQPQPKK